VVLHDEVDDRRQRTYSQSASKRARNVALVGCSGVPNPSWPHPQSILTTESVGSRLL
jgi:hypothetical protein